MFCPVIELTQQLIRRPSLSPDDAGCQALLIARLQAIGFHIETMNIDDTLNFWATRGEGKPWPLLVIPMWCHRVTPAAGSIRHLSRPFATACYLVVVLPT